MSRREHNLHIVSKTSHAHLVCYNFDIRERILIFLAEMLRIKQSIKRCFIVPPQISWASALPGKTGSSKIAFSLAVLVSTLLEFNQSLLDFFNLFDWRLNPHATVGLPKSCNQCVQLGAVVGAWFTYMREKKSRALQQLDCVARTKHQCTVFWVSSFAK